MSKDSDFGWADYEYIVDKSIQQSKMQAETIGINMQSLSEEVNLDVKENVKKSIIGNIDIDNREKAMFDYTKYLKDDGEGYNSYDNYKWLFHHSSNGTTHDPIVLKLDDEAKPPEEELEEEIEEGVSSEETGMESGIFNQLRKTTKKSSKGERMQTAVKERFFSARKLENPYSPEEPEGPFDNPNENFPHYNSGYKMINDDREYRNNLSNKVELEKAVFMDSIRRLKQEE